MIVLGIILGILGIIYVMGIIHFTIEDDLFKNFWSGIGAITVFLFIVALMSACFVSADNNKFMKENRIGDEYIVINPDNPFESEKITITDIRNYKNVNYIQYSTSKDTILHCLDVTHFRFKVSDD